MQHNKPGKLLLAVRFMLTIVLFTLCNISHAQENSPVKKDSIKKVQSASDSFNVNSLTPRGWVNDYEAIFSKEEVAVMDSLISEFEKKTTIEITIVTVKKEWVTAEHFDDLVNSIAQNWGIGKAGKDNGIVRVGAGKAKSGDTKGRDYLRLLIEYSFYFLENIDRIVERNTLRSLDNHYHIAHVFFWNERSRHRLRKPVSAHHKQGEKKQEKILNFEHQ